METVFFKLSFTIKVQVQSNT